MPFIDVETSAVDIASPSAPLSTCIARTDTSSDEFLVGTVDAGTLTEEVRTPRVGVDKNTPGVDRSRVGSNQKIPSVETPCAETGI